MKRRKWLAGLLTLAILCGMALPGGLCIRARAAQTDLTDGLVLYSSFDDESAKDISGNKHDGTVVGGIQFVDGISGKAIAISGQTVAGSDNDAGDRYVTYGASSAIIPDTGDFSLSVWFRSTGASSNSAILSNKNYKSGSNVGFALGCFASDLRLNLNTAGKTRADVQSQSGPLFDAKDGGWHQLTATFDRDGSMVCYVDGVSAGSKSIAANTGSVNAGLELVLGAGGNYCNAVNNCMLDELRIYNRALSAEEASALYALYADAATLDSVRRELQSMENALKSMQPGSVHSQQAIDEMRTVVQAALEELNGLNQTAALALLERVAAKYQEFMAGNKPMASFHLVSDVHIPSSSASSAEATNYIAAMENMKKINPDTTVAFVNAGDFTNNSSEAEYQGFYNLTKQYNPVTPEQTLIILGNHDVRGTAGTDQANWNKDPRYPEKCVYWETAKALYQQYNADYMPDSAQQTLYHVKELGGYTFIMLNTELGLKDAMYMSETQLQWLEDTMQAAYEKDPQKPIFIIGHQPLNDTHWMGNTLDGFDGIQVDGTPQPYQTGADARVKEIMAKYPNGIYLSGHIHNEFGRAEVIVRPYGVCVDLPSFGQGGFNSSEKGTGYEVQIYQDTVVFRAVNYVTGQWYPEYDVTVPVPGASAVYQQAKAILAEERYYDEDDIEAIAPLARQLENLLTKTYDQSGLSWNSTNPAPTQYYQAGDHAAIHAAAQALQEAMEGVERNDTPRDDPFEPIREKWRAYLLGGSGSDLDLSDSAVKAYVDGLNKTANGYWNSMVKSDTSNRAWLWEDIQSMNPTGYTSADYTKSGNMAEHFIRLRSIAYAWATKGCDLYQNDTVKNELIQALDMMVEKYFKASGYGYGNWYHWEITSGTALGNITLVLYDELGADRIETYGKAIQWYAPYCYGSGNSGGGPHSNGPKMTGGNLLLKANSVAQAAILLEDASMLENVKEGIKTVLVYNDPAKFYTSDADGFYADGSYIQHQALAYIGGYGADLYNNLGVFLNTLNGSRWEIRYDDGAEKIAYDFIFNGMEPFLYADRTMDMVSSRSITRASMNDKFRTSQVLSAILPLRGTFPSQAQNQRFDSMLKYILGQDPGFFYGTMDSITAIKLAKQLMDDSTIQPRSSYTLTKVFTMDKAVHITENFGFAISMHSSRTYGHELINNEGKQTWNTSDGMFYLYDADESQYSGGYWCTVDPTRLPGITAEHIVFNNGMGDRTKNIYDWTGGASLDSSAAVGSHLRTLGTVNSSTRNGTDVKKSWFLFDDTIVLMGSGITSSTGNTVETVVDNRKIQLDGSNTVTVDGNAANLGQTPTALTPTWMHLEGNVEGADIGYYFPQETTVQAMKDTRTGDWTTQGTTTGTATNTFATFYIDHGVNPSDESYAYVILPGKTAAQTAAFAAAPDVEILSQTDDVHAAMDKTNQIIAANFWENKTASVAGITVDRAASVVLRRSGELATLAVSDPTQRDEVITVTLALAGEVVSKDDSITVLQSEPFVKLSVDTAKLAGATSTITLRVMNSDEVQLVSTDASWAPLQVQEGTAFTDLPLPEKAVFMGSDMKAYELPISWSRTGYDGGTYGSYILTGTPVLPDQVGNSTGVCVQIEVRVGTFRVLATEDTYVNDGSKASDNFGSSATLHVKLDNTSYLRNALFKLDISALPTDYEMVTFDFTASMDPQLQGAALYWIDSNWSADTVTYNTAPAKRSETPLATFGVGDSDENGVIHLNVTQAVREAQNAGETVIAFQVSATGTKHSKNQMSISSLESDAAQKPGLTWSKTPGKSQADKENLRMLVEVATDLNPALFVAFDQQSLEIALEKAADVLEDANALQSEVSSAENALMHILLALRLKPVKAG